MRASLLTFAPQARSQRWARGLRLPQVLLLAILLSAPLLAAQEDDGDAPRLPGGQMLRGTVTAIHAGALTLKSETGDLYQITTTDNTRVIRDQQSARLADIKVGDGLGAAGILDAPNKTLHAAFLGVINAEDVRRAQAELGKSYIAGKITAIDIDALKITVERIDKAKQIIAVDESTSFRRGGRGRGNSFGSPPAGSASERPAAPTGESITLADLKVGDSIAGRGALKNGTFVPAELHVFDSTHSRRHPGANGSSPAGGAAAEIHP